MSETISPEAAFSLLRYFLREKISVDALVAIIESYLTWKCFYELAPSPMIGRFVQFNCPYCDFLYCKIHLDCHYGGYCIPCFKKKKCNQQREHFLHNIPLGINQSGFTVAMNAKFAEIFNDKIILS